MPEPGGVGRQRARAGKSRNADPEADGISHEGARARAILDPYHARRVAATQAWYRPRMGRARNPLSHRNRNAMFSGAEVRRVVEKLAASKRAKVVREAHDFDRRALESVLKPPLKNNGGGSWAIEDIIAARDQQMAGRFRLAARLAESMGTDPAIFTARGVRLAPVQSIAVEIVPSRAGKGDRIADEADALFGLDGISVSSETVTTIRSHLADHGVAFAAIRWTTRADGSRVDPVLSAWPIEFVWWHETAGCYVTPVRELAADVDPTPDHMMLPYGTMHAVEPIIHGNGRWVVFAKSEVLPHRLDAAVLAAGMVWARHAFAERDWAKGSAAHGNAKVVGELPPDTPLTDAEGDLTAEAAAMLTLVQAVASQDSPVGIRPAGSKIDYVTNTSRAWEVWKELAENAERSAARIYLGTDGVLGAQGGAPGVDVQALFGVATSKIQSDLRCIERGLQTGILSPWCAINFGDDKLAPTRRYVFPDADEAAVRADFSARNAAFLAAVKAARDAGLVVDAAYLAACAEQYGVPVPAIASDTRAPTDDPQ